MTAAHSTKPSTARKSSLVTSAPPAVKPPAKASKPKKAGTAPSAHIWHEIVATAAYYRALARGFKAGSAEQDWLDAEAELIQGMGKTQES